MKIFNHYSIKLRLIISVALGLFGMLLIATQSLVQTNEMLSSEKKQQVKHLVETAHSVIVAYYNDFESGNITEIQAQENAIKTIKVIRYAGGNYFWINDKYPKMIMHPIKPALDGKDLSAVKDPNGKYIFKAFVQKVEENAGQGIVDYQWPKPGSDTPIDKISFVKEFKPWGWIIGSGIYIDDINKSMWTIAYSLLINFTLIAFFLLLLSFIIAKSIIEPINKTTEALADLVKGEGDLTQRLPINGKDEIAKLSLSFNEFIGKIQSVIKTVQGSAKAVKHASIDLSTLSQESLAGSELQNAETAQIATASTQMVSTINEIAHSATTAANLAEGANTETQIGKSIVNDSAQSVQNLSVEIATASNVISELNAECSSIDSVLSVIKGIAEQTNLLALNAAIEAARAGEQGRGFAVVADEVRTLAGRTQAATLEINAIIAQLQNKANEAVSAIANSGDIAEDAVAQANKASLSLDSILEAIIAISDANHHIATAAEEQSSVTREIDERVVAIAGLSKESTALSSKISNGSDGLSELGIQLRELIKTFKV
ncbi:methyl-accepting chemotaxis protein [Psychromonas hadalis]|uniref:methyl-accepting chemotaxis protein n=1 Tax=Psychromonas hadalis TaxID=211669 RepID=UPI0003B4B400|nr:methyl-accepting chemotaxis protein [Psychromonas hadalis]